MLLSLTSSKANSTHPWQAENHQSGQHFRPKSMGIGLLQLGDGWATEVNHCSTAARLDCCCRLICGLCLRDHVTPALYELHWLPVEHSETFKLRAFMPLIHTGCSPLYQSELVTSTSSIVSRSRLRSASSRRYEQPATHLKLCKRSFAFAGPWAGNSLPTSLHEITNYKAFKRELETVLFKRAFSA